MEYITTKNGKITGHFCGDNLPKEAIQVSNWWGNVGDSVNYYDDKWNRKDDIELYKTGVMEIPEGYKLNDDETAVIEMSEVEKIQAGIKKLPDGMKIENNEIVSKTMEEKLADNEITQTEYNNYLINDYKQKLRDTDYIIAKLTEALAINDSNEVAAIESEYAEQLTNRKNWRNKINELQEKINQLDNSDDSSD